jgi:hypothetical protein
VSDELRKQLSDARAAEIARTADQLKSEPSAVPAEGLERIRAYTTLLAALPPNPTHEKRWAMAIAIAAALTAGLLWGTRLPRTRVLVNVDASALELTLAEAWSMAGSDAPAASPGVRIDALTALSGSLVNLKGETNDAWLRADGYRVRPAELSLEKNGQLVIQMAARDGAVQWFSRGARLSGVIEIDGAGTLSAGASNGQTDSTYNGALSDVESVRFSSSGANAVATMLAFGPITSWTIRDLAVNRLSFSWDERAQPGGAARRTPVIGGEVTLFDSSTKVPLGDGERLSLQDLRGRIVELRIDKQIHLRVEGDVGEIIIGPKGFERTLTPTYLEYFRSHPSISVFWSAAVFVAGSLWSAKRLLMS